MSRPQFIAGRPQIAGRFQPIGDRSSTPKNHWQGRIIDLNEKFPPRSDPRSAFAPAVLNPSGACSERLTREFLRKRICACWNLTSISPFFLLLHSNRTRQKLFLFRTTFNNLSIANCTVLWRVAQTYNVGEASTRLGRALKKAFESYDRKADEDEERARVEDEAFRILARRLDSAQNTTTTRSTTSLYQTDGTAAQHNENDIESAEARVPEPAKDSLKSLTVKSIVDEFSSTEATNHLVQLITRVEEAISNRDMFIVGQLHQEDAKISREISELLLEKTRHEKAEEAHCGIQKLGSYLDAFKDDGMPLSPYSGAKQALNALQEEIEKLGTKRPRDYELESEALRGKQKRIKAQVEVLTEKESTFSASEHLKVYKE